MERVIRSLATLTLLTAAVVPSMATDKRTAHLRLRAGMTAPPQGDGYVELASARPEHRSPSRAARDTERQSRTERGLASHRGRAERARWFIPGDLGFEPGLVRPGSEEPGANAFLTRAFSGLNSPEERAWAAANGLGSRPAFSHNLARVFPPALFDTHPEFFPLVNGQRQRPQRGPVNWNPDLGSEAVAAHAAAAARAHFAANPEADSFALGVNDGLVFGESEAVLALVKPAPAPPLSVKGYSLMGSDPESRGLPASGGAEGGGRRAEISLTADSKPNNQEPITNNRDGGTSASSETTRWFRHRPDYSNLVFTFMNRVAAQVAPDYPDHHLGALAYYWAENAPDFCVHPMVMPFLTADRSQGYDRAFREEEAALQARWAARQARPAAPAAQLSVKGYSLMGSDPESRGLPASGGTDGGGQRAEGLDPNNQEPTTDNRRGVAPRLGLYDYVYGAGFLVPRQHTGLIGSYLGRARRLGFTDYYAEMQPNWGLDGAQPWLIAQLLQDPDASPAALLDEYYRRYFREAAGPMRRFFELCERQWMRQPGSAYWLKHYRNESQAALFPPEVCARLRALLDEAGRRARSPEVARRVAFVAEAFGVTERFVAFQEARTALVRAALAPRPDPTDGAVRLQAYLAAREEFVTYTDALRAREPLALAAFRWDDYLKSDPVWLAMDRFGFDSSTNSGRVDLRGWREGTELVRDGGLEGQGVPARRIAGLPYAVDTPAAWASRAEPVEFLQFSLDAKAARTGRQGLRVAGAADVSVFQWSPTTGGGTHVASVWVRAKVPPSGVVTLTLGWLDEANRHLGAPRTIRLPEGDWPEWVELVIGGEAPAEARWVGVGMRVQHQIDGGWAEFDDFSLREVAPAARLSVNGY